MEERRDGSGYGPGQHDSLVPDELDECQRHPLFSANGANGAELWRSDGTAAGTVQVKDINTSGSSSPSNLFDYNGILVFAANASPTATGIELWKSDGNDAGTVLVKDIYSTSGNSSPGNFTLVGNTLYFTATDATGGTELWKMEGPNAEPVRVKDINPGATGSNPTNLVNFGGTLYFAADDGTNGWELWKSDGTATGTVMAADLNYVVSGGVSQPGRSSYPQGLTVAGTTLYFSAYEYRYQDTPYSYSSTGQELWAVDSPGATPRLVKDIYADGNGSYPQNLTAVGSSVYFAANIAATGTELWKSDGTAAGTVLVKDIYQGTTSSNPQNLRSVNGALFLTANDGATGIELWRTDGTTAGTARVRDVNAISAGSNPSGAVEVGGTRYLAATDATGGTELWRTDGTAAGTWRVKDINPGATGSNPTNLVNFGGTLYFAADDGANGRELWKSDGTATGTVMAADLSYQVSGGVSQPGYSSYPQGLTVAGTTLYFNASEYRYRDTPYSYSFTGQELWAVDSPGATPRLVKDIYADGNGSSPQNLTAVGSSVYFAANIAATGTELWKSDGTAAGTVLVKDIYQGTTSSNLQNLRNVNGSLFFVATDPVYGTELWTTDGTAGGTLPAFDVNTISAGSNPTGAVETGGIRYFAATDAVGGTELWRTDGTEAGTWQVKDINPGATGSNPTNLVNFGGTLYFAADDGTNGRELWKSDGTATGTVMAADLSYWVSGGVSQPGYSSSPQGLTVAGATLYFNAYEYRYRDTPYSYAYTGQELWAVDFPGATPHLVKDIYADGTGSSPQNLTAVGSSVYFAANIAATGTELWKSDGTAAGTVLVKDIYQGTTSSNLQNLRNVNGSLFFVAIDPVYGTELWTTDGTAGGTLPTYDVFSGPAGSSPSAPVGIGAAVYWSANDGINGQRLYRRDAGGTTVIANSTNASNLAAVGSSLYFTRSGQLWTTDGGDATQVSTAVSSVSNLMAGPGEAVYFSGFGSDGSGNELWKSNGTSALTVRVADIVLGTGSSSPVPLLNNGGFLFFTASDPVYGNELWSTDGITTARVKDINNATAGSSPSAPVAAGGAVYWTANDGINGQRLYRRDAGGTTVIANSSNASNLAAVGSSLYFTRSGQLWTTDGGDATQVSTAVYNVSNLMAGPGGAVYFSGFGSDGSGNEMWKSDGSPIGTIRVADIAVGPASSSPVPLLNSAGLLFFTADDGIGGRELWVTDGESGTLPLAYNQFVTVQEDGAQAITLVGTDAENDPLTYEILLVPTHGSLTGSGANLTYNPAAEYSGTDSFTFRVFDGQDYSNTAVVSITVVSVNDLPQVNAGTDKTANEGALVSFSGSATDVEGGTLTYAWNFGDGDTATGATASHAFEDNGTYTVTLGVTDRRVVSERTR